jgi:hypothetical protein
MTAPSLAQDTKVIGLVALAHGLSHFYQIVTAVLFPLIREDLGVSYAALGATTAAYYVVSGVCQTLAGLRSIASARAACCSADLRCALPARSSAGWRTAMKCFLPRRS